MQNDDKDIIKKTMTLIPGPVVIIRPAGHILSKSGALILMLFSFMMLPVGGGLMPSALGVVARVIGAQVRQKDSYSLLVVHRVQILKFFLPSPSGPAKKSMIDTQYGGFRHL